MTNVERVAAWHATRPDFTDKWSAHDWDHAERVAEHLDQDAAPENVSCDLAPEGWYCALEKNHSGDCRAFETDPADD